jgi:hypothetical protein
VTNHTITVLSERKKGGKYHEDQTTWESLDRQVLVEGEETVAIYQNKLTEGISVNGKPWKRWSLENAVFFSMRQTYNGQPVLKVYVKKKYRKPGAARLTTSLRDVTKVSGLSAGYLQNSPEVREAVLKLVAKNTSHDIETLKSEIINGSGSHAAFKIAFPLFSHWTNTTATVGIPHMRSTDINDFTKKLFGKTRYRKDLVKAIAGCNSPESLKNAYALRGLVPIDWIIRYLREAAKHPKQVTSRGITYGLNPEVMHLREGFKKMTPAQRKSFFPTLLSTEYSARYLVEDTMRSITKLPEEIVHAVKMKPSELKRFHDTLAAEVRKQKEKNQTIPATALAKKIKDITFDGITVVPATTTHEVIGWGTDMNHCIASYNWEAVAQTKTLVAVYQDGNLIGNASFRKNNSCEQAFGKNNQRLPEEVLESLKKGLKDIVDFKGAWGVDKSSYF